MAIITYNFKWMSAFLLSASIVFYGVHLVTSLEKSPKVRGVNLGGWLVVEGWMYEKPNMFDDIPNHNMLDGRQVQFKSVALQKYVSAENGGNGSVTVNRTQASSWETFKLWRVSEHEFQFRTSNGQFLSCAGEGSILTAKAISPSNTETFYIEKVRNDSRVRIRLSTGFYLQAESSKQIIAAYPGNRRWNDNKATFIMSLLDKLEGDYQLANGYGPTKAKEILKKHRETYITAKDFKYISEIGLNTVRIPVPWWIYKDPNPPVPYVGGVLEALDNAFSWAQDYNIKCIIDLHSAQGSQNEWDNSGNRDGTIEWPKYTAETLDVIDFLAARYAKHPALLGIALLNEPIVPAIPLDILVSYYSEGYKIVRKYSSTTYVILGQRIGKIDRMELLTANIGSENLVIDLHYYNFYHPFFYNFTVADHIQYIYKSRKDELQLIQKPNGPLIFIGEWAIDMNLTSVTKFDVLKYANAQLDVYGTSSFGWTYWSYKSVKNYWSFKWGIENNYINLGGSRDFVEDIAFKNNQGQQSQKI